MLIGNGKNCLGRGIWWYEGFKIFFCRGNGVNDRVDRVFFMKWFYNILYSLGNIWSLKIMIFKDGYIGGDVV